MQKKLLRSVAENIARDVALEMRSPQGVFARPSETVLELLLGQLADRMAGLLADFGSGGEPSDESLAGALRKAERKLEKLVVDGDGGKGDAEVTHNGFPNLKYAEPKYKNLESVLKYVDGEDDRGGVKLVIMNFND